MGELVEGTSGILSGGASIYRAVTVKQVEAYCGQLRQRLVGDEELVVTVLLNNGEKITVERFEAVRANLIAIHGVDQAARQVIALLPALGLQIVLTVVKRPGLPHVKFG